MDKFECTNCYYSFYETEQSPKKLIADENGKVIGVDGITKTNNDEVGCGICGGGILYKVER